MGSAVVITIDLWFTPTRSVRQVMGTSTYGSGQNCSGAIAAPPVAPGLGQERLAELPQRASSFIAHFTPATAAATRTRLRTTFPVGGFSYRS